jgi:hypothetical protein
MKYKIPEDRSGPGICIPSSEYLLEAPSCKPDEKLEKMINQMSE